ncbi:hypothetical protein Rsub_00721 [Raphidocelis subcapitata]|uniref:Uncharacterized protein n=1 Tax=Raphidocelis subcapitata TaxID=307507 RepID=A0A2V0NLM8_9CHLO|nr:hypothetical protein Rsub_00721 [Raphidocelis subcapitata]|eukprot:GBF88009.1 hypothetical protein Rsub_00721 [Raphidocelis subcapitata]
MMASRRRSPLAPPKADAAAQSFRSDAAQVWSLAFAGRASAPAAEQQQHRFEAMGGCAIAFLDLIDTPEGESLRLYFDAEAEEGVAEPMASSLAVIELPAGGAPSSSSCPERGGALRAAWAGAQRAWYPDAAHVCCGRPGHYQGCLVWGSAKAEAALSALCRGEGGGGGGGRALAFAFGSHPVGARLLGRRLCHSVELLVQVPACGGAACDDLWCRLPGASFEAVDGGVPEHHQRRLTELRRCGGGGGACGGGFRVGGGGAGGGGGLESSLLLSALARASRGGSSAGGSVAGRCSESECPWTGRARARSSSCGSSSDADSGAPGGPAHGGAAGGTPALSVLSCPSASASVAAGTPSASTPTAAASSRRDSRCSGAGDDAPSSPFAALCGEEYWDEELLVVAQGGW